MEKLLSVRVRRICQELEPVVLDAEASALLAAPVGGSATLVRLLCYPDNGARLLASRSIYPQGRQVDCAEPQRTGPAEEPSDQAFSPPALPPACLDTANRPGPCRARIIRCRSPVPARSRHGADNVKAPVRVGTGCSTGENTASRTASPAAPHPTCRNHAAEVLAKWRPGSRCAVQERPSWAPQHRPSRIPCRWSQLLGDPYQLIVFRGSIAARQAARLDLPAIHANRKISDRRILCLA